MKIRVGTIHGSTFVKGAGFSGAAGEVGTLRIKFNDAVIDFTGVPYSVFRALVRSRDPAHFYLHNIYGDVFVQQSFVADDGNIEGEIHGRTREQEGRHSRNTSGGCW